MTNCRCSLTGCFVWLGFGGWLGGWGYLKIGGKQFCSFKHVASKTCFLSMVCFLPISRDFSVASMRLCGICERTCSMFMSMDQANFQHFLTRLDQMSEAEKHGPSQHRWFKVEQSVHWTLKKRGTGFHSFHCRPLGVLSV